MATQSDIREITETTDRAMTVRDLIEALEGADPDARVLFVCNYGDYSNTQQALPVEEVVADCSLADLATSAYSQSGLAMIENGNEEDEDEEEDEDGFPDDEDMPVVFLRM